MNQPSHTCLIIYLAKTLQLSLINQLKKSYNRETLIEEIEVYSSFRPSVSTTISAEKHEQITVSSESDSDETTSHVEYFEQHVNVKTEENQEPDSLIEVSSDSDDGESICASIRNINKRGRAA